MAIKDNEVHIECEDALLLFQRVTIPNGELKNINLKTLLEYVVGKVNDFIKAESLGESLSIDCQYSYGYDKFTFVNNATAYDVMEKLQKEGLPDIYISDNVLHLVPQYTNISGNALYSFKRNIQKNDLNLKWREASDRELLVVATAKKKDGSEITATAGAEGGNVLRLNLNSIRTKEELQKIADNQYAIKTFTGCEGSFKAWLVPYCDANYSVTLMDSPDRTLHGTYYVQSVEVEFSSSGASRTVRIQGSLNTI